MPLKRSKVTADALRTLFNQSGIETSTSSKEYLFVFARDRVPKILPASEPAGTRSQIARVHRLPSLQLVAILHRYLRPDQSIGASGMWDPKWLLIEDTIYSL